MEQTTKRRDLNEAISQHYPEVTTSERQKLIDFVNDYGVQLVNEEKADWIEHNKIQNTPACFTDAVRPAIKWLAEKHHPHVTAIVTSTGAQILESQENTGEILDYLRD